MSLNKAMEQRDFGRTGLKVSVLGWGAAEIGFENSSDQMVDTILGVGSSAGINVIDTAECYMNSEAKLGRVLGARRKQFLLFTKCGHRPAFVHAGLFVRAYRKFSRPLVRLAGRMLEDWDPRLLERSIDRSLRRLRTDWLDLVQLHGCSEEILRDGKAIDVLQ